MGKNLRANREMVRLGDVCEIVSGTTPKSNVEEYWNGTENWVTPAELNEDTLVIFDTDRKITALAIKESSLKPFPAGTVLLSSRAPIGKVAIAGTAMYCNQGFKNFICSEKIFNKFLYWFLKGKTDYLNSLGRGATFKEISKLIVQKIELPLLPLDEQKCIAKNLDLASEIVKGYKEQLAELNKLVQSVFYEMFGDPVTNEKGWETTNLGRCIELLSDFSANGAYEYLDSHVKMYDEPNYALMIRTTDLEKNDFTNGVKYIDENAYNILEKSKVFGNEIIMSKIGSAGKIYLMPKLGIPVSLGRNAFLIRLKQNADVIFLYNLLSTNYGKTEIMQYVRGAVTKAITKDSVRAIRIVLPPLELQTRFASIVTEIETQKAQVQQALTEAENLYNSLMQEYFE